MRKSLPFGAPSILAVAWAFLLGSCASPNQTELVIADPNHLRQQASFLTLAVVKGECPASLADGVLPETVVRQTIAASIDFGPVGSLQAERYAFAVIARDSNCGVIGFGCTPTNLAEHRRVTVELNSLVNPPRSRCAVDEVCQLGSCEHSLKDANTDSQDNLDAKPDAPNHRCRLQYVTRGTLHALPASAPPPTQALALGTPDGFLIGTVFPGSHQESPKIKLIPLSLGGHRGTDVDHLVGGPTCLTTAALTASLAWNSSLNSGLVLLASPSCDGKSPTLDAWALSGTGELLASRRYPLLSPLKADPVRALASSRDGQTTSFVAFDEALPFLYQFTSINVASSRQPLQDSDASAADGVKIASTATSEILAIVGNNRTEIQIRKQASDVRTVVLDASILDLTSWDTGFAALHAADQGIQWTVYNADGLLISSGLTTTSPSLQVQGQPVADTLFIATGLADDIVLNPVDGIAAGQPTPHDAKVALGDYLTEAERKELDPSTFALAASGSRIVVVGLNRHPVDSQAASTGIYVLLGCDPKP